METDHRDSGFDAMEKTPICALSQICHKYDLRVVTACHYIKKEKNVLTYINAVYMSTFHKLKNS